MISYAIKNVVRFSVLTARAASITAFFNKIVAAVDIEGKAANLLTAGGSGTEVNSTKNLSPYHAWDYVLDDLHSSNVDQDSNESLASGVDSTIRDFMASDR